MSLAAAVARLKTWTITGLVTNYGFLASIAPPHTKCPALVLELVDPFGFPQYFQAANVGATVGVAAIYVEHKLLIRGYNLGLPDAQGDDLTAWIDLYLAKAADDFRLNANLIEPLSLLIRAAGKVTCNGNDYLGVSFLHVWKFKVT
jgi:hypothetical protein